MAYKRTPQRILHDTATLMPAPRANRPDRNETKVMVICEGCGHRRWLTTYQAELAAKSQRCKRCATRYAGKLGYKKGGKKAFEAARQWRIANPSSLEKVVIDALDRLNMVYEREHVHTTALGVTHCVDFQVTGNVAFFIEVDGAYTHNNDYMREPELVTVG